VAGDTQGTVEKEKRMSAVWCGERKVAGAARREKGLFKREYGQQGKGRTRNKIAQRQTDM